MRLGKLLSATAAALFAVLVISLNSSGAEAASFVKFDGIKGEATAADDGHKDWINLISVSFGGTSRAGADMMKPPRGQGPGTIRITKSSDWATTTLMRQMSSGSPMPKVTIYRALPSKTESYMKYELENVVISSFNSSGPSTADHVPTEEISLNYEKISWSAADDKPWMGAREMTARPTRKVKNN